MKRDRPYLDWLREQPCLVTGFRGTESDPVDPAHIGTAGRGVKSNDDEAIPLLHSIHMLCHQKGEISTLRARLPDYVLRAALRAYARELYREYEMEEAR